MKASMQLSGNYKHDFRKRLPESFIIVFENVLYDSEKTFRDEGQRVRSEREIEDIFRQANLRVFKKSERLKVHPDYRPVVVWALY